VVTCIDVTRPRYAEQRLQQFAEQLQLSKVELERAYTRLEEMHESVEGRAQELERLNEELRKLNEMKSRLLGNVSHELQTPLVSIRGYTEMILKGRLGPVTDEQSRGLSLALKNIDRLIGMIDNLLSFSRGTPEVGRLELSRFALGPLVTEAVELLRPKLEEKALHLDGTVEEGLDVHADRDKVLQVIVNLLSNAVKFNRQGGRITLSTRRRSDDLIQVQVSDTGVGIAREQLDRVFDRHFRANTGDAPAPGSGIGLAIVRDILRVHGCTIQVESEVGRGSTFSFTLPAGLNMEPPQPSAKSEAPPEARYEPEAGLRPEVEPEAAAEQIPSPGAQDRPPADGPPDSSAAPPRPRFRVIRRYDPQR
jgi:signal transduction histidine kinase